MVENPYAYLEDPKSKKGVEFALVANRMCLKALGDPLENSETYSRILRSLDGDDRIPFVSKSGKDENGRDILFNLWKDSKVTLGKRYQSLISEALSTYKLLFFLLVCTASQRCMAEDNF